MSKNILTSKAARETLKATVAKSHPEKLKSPYAVSIADTVPVEIEGFSEIHGMPFAHGTNMLTGEQVHMFRDWMETEESPNPLRSLASRVEDGAIVIFKNIREFESAQVPSGSFLADSFQTMVADNDYDGVEILHDVPMFPMAPTEDSQGRMIQVFNVIEEENSTKISSPDDLAMRLKKFQDEEYKRPDDSFILRVYSPEEDIVSAINVAIEPHETLRDLARRLSTGNFFLLMTGKENNVVDITGQEIMNLLSEEGLEWEFIPVTGLRRVLPKGSNEKFVQRMETQASNLFADFAISEKSYVKQGIRKAIIGVRQFVNSSGRTVSRIESVFYDDTPSLPLEAVSTHISNPDIARLTSYYDDVAEEYESSSAEFAPVDLSSFIKDIAEETSAEAEIEGYELNLQSIPVPVVEAEEEVLVDLTSLQAEEPEPEIEIDLDAIEVAQPAPVETTEAVEEQVPVETAAEREQAPVEAPEAEMVAEVEADEDLEIDLDGFEVEAEDVDISAFESEPVQTSEEAPVEDAEIKADEDMDIDLDGFADEIDISALFYAEDEPKASIGEEELNDLRAISKASPDLQPKPEIEAAAAVEQQPTAPQEDEPVVASQPQPQAEPEPTPDVAAPAPKPEPVAPAAAPETEASDEDQILSFGADDLSAETLENELLSLAHISPDSPSEAVADEEDNFLEENADSILNAMKF